MCTRYQPLYLYYLWAYQCNGCQNIHKYLFVQFHIQNLIKNTLVSKSILVSSVSNNWTLLSDYLVSSPNLLWCARLYRGLCHHLNWMTHLMWKFNTKFHIAKSKLRRERLLSHYKTVGRLRKGGFNTSVIKKYNTLSRLYFMIPYLHLPNGSFCCVYS